MDEIRQNHAEQRKAIMNEHMKYGNLLAVHRLYDGTPVCCATTDDKLNLEMNNLIRLRKTEKPIRYRINQLVRIRTVDGNDHLKVQAFIDVPNDQGQTKTYSADSLGFNQFPIYEPVVAGYNPSTGLPEESHYEIARVEDKYSIPFSAEQVEALSKHFIEGVSLIIKPPSGKRYTAESLEQFCGPYESAMASLKDYEKRLDERVANILKGVK